MSHKSPNVAGETRSDARVASEGPPRYDEKTRPLHVGRGPVPRHAAIAGETLSDARVASEGPRATVKNGPFHRRARALAGCHTRRRFTVRLHHLCRSGSPDPDRSRSGDLELQRWARCLLVGETSWSRCGVYREDIETPAVVCSLPIGDAHHYSLRAPKA